MHTSGHVDWWACTYPSDKNPLTLLPELLTHYPFIDAGSGPHGYHTRLENEMGVTIYRDGTKQQGQHVILTGQAMAQYHSAGGTDRALCIAAVSKNARASRLDVAVDIWDSAIKIEALVGDVRSGRVKTRAKASRRIEHLIEKGEGVYIGSPASNRLFRAYNKAFEQHTDENWIRLEMQLRKQYAQATLHTIANEVSTRDVINQSIVTFVDFPDNPDFQEATKDRAVTLPRVPRKVTSTYRWLIDIVAPAMAHYNEAHPDDNVLDAFLTAYRVASEPGGLTNPTD